MIVFLTVLLFSLGALAFILEHCGIKRKHFLFLSSVLSFIFIIGVLGLIITLILFNINVKNLNAEASEVARDAYYLFLEASSVACGFILLITVVSTVISHKMKGTRILIAFLTSIIILLGTYTISAWSQLADFRVDLYILYAGIFLSFICLLSPTLDMLKYTKSLKTAEGCELRQNELYARKEPSAKRAHIKEKRKSVKKRH